MPPSVAARMLPAGSNTSRRESACGDVPLAPLLVMDDHWLPDALDASPTKARRLKSDAPTSFGKGVFCRSPDMYTFVALAGSATSAPWRDPWPPGKMAGGRSI